VIKKPQPVANRGQVDAAAKKRGGPSAQGCASQEPVNNATDTRRYLLQNALRARGNFSAFVRTWPNDAQPMPVTVASAAKTGRLRWSKEPPFPSQTSFQSKRRKKCDHIRLSMCVIGVSANLPVGRALIRRS